MKASALTKSTAWYSAGNLFARSASFLLLPLYSNLITPDDFGKYALIMSFYNIAMVLYQGGYQSALTKFYLGEPEISKRKVVFSSITIAAVSIALLLSIITFFLSDYISILIFGSGDYSYLIKLLAAAMFFETAGTQFLNLFMTRQFASMAVKVISTGALFNFVLNIILVYFFRMNIEGIFLAQLFSSMIVVSILFVYGYKELTSEIDVILLKQLYIFTLPLIIGGLMSVGIDVADRFILNHYLGTKDVGIYSFAYRIAMVMNLFVISFRTAWMPYSLKLYYSGDYKNTYSGILLKYIAAAGIVFCTISLLGDDLFDISIKGFAFFERQYEGGIYILPFILGGYLMNGIGSFFSVYPFVSGKTYHFVISDGLGFLLNIILNLTLIPMYGLTGAAIATLLSLTVAAGYLFLISRGQISLEYSFTKIAYLIILIGLITSVGLIVNMLYMDIMLIGSFIIILLLILKIRFADILTIFSRNKPE